MTPQISFGSEDFATNPEPRCPCLLLLDTSGSMDGLPIQELNQGLVAFQADLITDDLAAKRVEVAIVTFGPVEVCLDFTGATSFIAPTLKASGNTPLGEAIARGLDLLDSRKTTYQTSGIAYFRPFVFLITDGAPTDAWQEAATRIHEGQRLNRFNFFSVGVAGADFSVLRQLSPTPPLELKALRFRDLFKWLSASMKTVSQSRPGELVTLQEPVTPSGWAQIPV